MWYTSGAISADVNINGSKEYPMIPSAWENVADASPITATKTYISPEPTNHMVIIQPADLKLPHIETIENSSTTMRGPQKSGLSFTIVRLNPSASIGSSTHRILNHMSAKSISSSSLQLSVVAAGKACSVREKQTGRAEDRDRAVQWIVRAECMSEQKTGSVQYSGLSGTTQQAGAVCSVHVQVHRR